MLAALRKCGHDALVQDVQSRLEALLGSEGLPNILKRLCGDAIGAAEGSTLLLQEGLWSWVDHVVHQLLVPPQLLPEQSTPYSHEKKAPSRLP